MDTPTTPQEIIDQHFNHFLALLDVERDAEREENKRALDRLPTDVRESLGKTVTRLSVVKQDTGVGGLPLLVLSRAPAGEVLSPFHAMDQGDVVRVGLGLGAASVDGTLYNVDEYQVTVALKNPLPELPRGRCQIDLLGSDATYKRMKKALEKARDAGGRLGELRDILLGLRLPEVSDDPAPPFFDDSLNVYQQEAVRRALDARDAAVVHGPPGTGKTTVLVEIIRQAVESGQRVLATAPSNIAVDNILERLLFTDLNVVRLGHPARTLETLRHATLMARVAEHPDQRTIRDLLQEKERLVVQRARRNDRGDGLEREEWKTYQETINSLTREARDLERSLTRRVLDEAEVVLSTHAGLAWPIYKDGFDLAVLDEASQSMEPLSWVPLIQARKVILAGDPLQLPPTIYSKEAAQQGLGTTLMERLQKILPENLQTLLRTQYRMHKTIMGFSSHEFYEDKLEADPSVAEHVAAEMPGVQATELTSGPLIYVDTAGAGYDEVWNEILDSRENEGEAALALKIWGKLSEAGLRLSDAAIITPYAAQARLLKHRVPKGLEVGTVDGFQGREKEVVIVSLVRSNDKGEVGFLGDTRRMNVAMTRARRLLIVIGDSATISRHPFYADFLDYVAQRGQQRSVWDWT